MFCPNCGTKNDDTATPCKKCGFKLSGASAPKFRGTMMLNTDQSVQDMVEEHRKKLAEAGEAPDAAGAGGPTPPLPSVGSTPPKAVLQPPRAALAKRRMGTMLGVAPQAGGFQPPQGYSPTPTPAPAEAPAASPRPEVTPPSAPDPFAGTVAFGAVSPVAPQVAPPASASAAVAAGRTEAFAAVPATPPTGPAAALAAGRTEAFEAPPVAALPAEPVRPPAEPAASPPTDAAAPALARGRTEAFDAPPAAHAGELASVESAPSVAPARRRQVRPLELFLIVATCGLYGLVLWARQRKPADR